MKIVHINAARSCGETYPFIKLTLFSTGESAALLGCEVFWTVLGRFAAR